MNENESPFSALIRELGQTKPGNGGTYCHMERDAMPVECEVVAADGYLVVFSQKAHVMKDFILKDMSNGHCFVVRNFVECRGHVMALLHPILPRLSWWTRLKMWWKDLEVCYVLKPGDVLMIIGATSRP